MSEKADKALDALLHAIAAAREAGLNYAEVAAAQAAADAEGRELNAEERARFRAEARAAVNRL